MAQDHRTTADRTRDGGAMDGGAMVDFSRAAIERVAAAISPYIRETPVIEADGADFGLPGVRLAFKLELLQHSGSFKTRGAFSNLLERPTPAAGVAAASGGNHGAAVAYAAMRLAVPAKIFVPEIASPAKIDRIRSYGADLVVGGQRYADALEACEAYLAASGAMGVHAYDAPETIRGAGSLAREFERQVAELGRGHGRGQGSLDAVLVAVGGGGLLSGVASWFAGGPKIVAVETEGTATLHMALKAGQPVDVALSGVAADSLGAKRIGAHAFPIARREVAASILVPDAAILLAQKALWERLRIVAEPGGAAGLAALLSGAYKPARGAHVGVIVCGGNTAAVNFTQ